MKKLLFIINPVAGRRHARSAMFDVVHTFCKAGYEVTTAVTLARGHGKQLAMDAEKNGFDLVVCIGGDGTLNEIISGLAASNSSLPLGYIPAGSTNDFARTLGLSLKPIKAAENIVKEEPKTLDIGSFNNGEAYFSYIASFGAFSAASYNAPQAAKNKFGHFAYVLEGINELGNIHSYNITLQGDGKDYSGRYIFGAVSNTKSVGGIVRLKDDEVDLNDGLFEVTLIKRPFNYIDLQNIIMGITTSNFDNKSFVHFQAAHLEFNLSKAVPWTLDGEEANGGSKVILDNLYKKITIYK